MVVGMSPLPPKPTNNPLYDGMVVGKLYRLKKAMSVYVDYGLVTRVLQPGEVVLCLKIEKTANVVVCADGSKWFLQLTAAAAAMHTERLT